MNTVPNNVFFREKRRNRLLSSENLIIRESLSSVCNLELVYALHLDGLHSNWS